MSEMMKFIVKHRWWSISIGGVLCYTVLYIKQYYRQLPSKTQFDQEAEKSSLENIKKRSIPSNYVNTPIQIRGLKLRNRIIKSGTFESASFKGKVTDKLIKFHLDQALNAGMVTVSYGCISPEGRTFPDQLLLIKENKNGLISLVNTIHSKTKSKISIQLTDAGLMAEPIYDNYAKCNKYNHIYSASRVWSWSALQYTKQMTIRDIRRKINKFSQSALLCKQYGFDAITLHCGHGYLISQFISLITNKRNDKYGNKTIETRIQFAVDIIKQIRILCGDTFPIFIKINTHDGINKINGGLSVNESIEMCKILMKNGVDVIIPTAGFINKNGIFMMRGSVPIYKMFIESASYLKKIGIGLVGPWLIPNIQFRSMFLWETSLKLLNGLINIERDDNINDRKRAIICYLGGVTSLKDINKAFESGFELVAMARTLLREPDFLDKIKENPNHVSLCDHKNRCIIGQMSGKPLKCYERDDCGIIDIEECVNVK